MIPAPRPCIITKDRFTVKFNEPREQGCLSVEIDGHGLSVMLDPDDMMKLCEALFASVRRIKRNQRASAR